MICRVDGLFKLSNGEKVSSMMVENAITITSSPFFFHLKTTPCISKLPIRNTQIQDIRDVRFPQG